MMQTKEQIVAEIQRLAAVYGGRLSLRTFCDESGLKEYQILGTHWVRWNDALREAGVTTGSFFNPKTEDAEVIETFSHLAKQLNRWPTQNDLLIERRRNESFPSLPVIRRVRATPSFVSRVVSFCSSHPDLSGVAQIAADVAQGQSREKHSTTSQSVSGFVYMMRTGQRFKIGHTNSPTRRHREVRLELPDPTTVIHTIATDDPDGVEAYWHKRFHLKRVRDTEFFELDANDVSAFKRWKRIS